MELTEVGRIFLVEARRAVEQVQKAEDVARRTHRGEYGRLTIGFVGSATYGVLSEVLRRYRAQYPDVELHLTEMTTAQQAKALRDRKIEVGFVRTPFREAGLLTKQLFTENFVLALPASHRLCSKTEVALSELALEPFILFPPGLGSGLYDPIIEACRLAGFTPRVAQDATQMHTILGLTAVGFGVAIVPECVRLLNWKGVVLKPLVEPRPRTGIALAWHAANESSTLKAFLAQAGKKKRSTVVSQ